ncbi:unnamed protein product [Sphagnum compactum]
MFIMLSNTLFLFLFYLVLFLFQNKVPQFACDFGRNPRLRTFAFCDRNLSDDVRVKDLVSRLTLDEKITQLVNSAASVPSLGLPSYQWWNEALHGVARSRGVDFTGSEFSLHAATSFPVPLLSSASFNSCLWQLIGQVVSTEARAFFNHRRANLTFWAPNINIVRDPRWGRAQETSGEDPIVASMYATFFVRGMQDWTPPPLPLNSNCLPAGAPAAPGPSATRLKVSACCKHFVAYDLDNWKGMDRYHFDAQVTVQDLEDSFTPPFKSCVEEGRASGLMCSYNRINGVPACASYPFLTQTVRNTWGFDGYIVSDCGAILDMQRLTPYAATPEDAVAYAFNAGVDVECGHVSLNSALSALQQGILNESVIDKALFYQLSVRMRLGLFDGDPKQLPYGAIGVNQVCSNAHQELALEAARQGTVLLKNEDATLPFSRQGNLTLAVIGPHANSTTDMLGNYKGYPCKYITPLQGLAEFGTRDNRRVLYARGCRSTACVKGDLISIATSTAAKADAVVIVVGLNQAQEAEKRDRVSLRLPGRQEELILAIAGNVTRQVAIVVVVMSGGPLDMRFAKEDERIQSILWVGYPGEAGGQAMSEVIFGDHNPGGRLPLSWYPEEYTRISMTDMHMRPNPTLDYPGRTYRFYTDSTVYEFGHGLSYSSFRCSILSAPLTIRAHPGICKDSSNIDIRIKVTNTGEMKGRHSVLLFAASPSAGADGAPLKKLVRFQLVQLESGQESELIFNLNPCKDLGTVTEDGSHILEIGRHTLSIGTEGTNIHSFQVHRPQ